MVASSERRIYRAGGIIIPGKGVVRRTTTGAHGDLAILISKARWIGQSRVADAYRNYTCQRYRVGSGAALVVADHHHVGVTLQVAHFVSGAPAPPARVVQV